MPDVVALGMSGAQWLLVGLAAAVGAVSAWLTVLLLAWPGNGRGFAGFAPLRGLISVHSGAFAAFADTHLLAQLPAPRLFFEQLGPDRFRREFGHALKARIDEHVDDVMARRNERAWESLSVYARNRVYAHVHRRLPYAIDDFVDHIQRDLDDIVHPSVLVHRHFAEHPDTVPRLFLASFGRQLRSLLPLAALAGGGVGYLCMGLGSSPWSEAFVLTVAALAGSSFLLFSLGRPAGRVGPWPLPGQGVLHRRRRHFLQALARSTANESLAWRALVGELLHGAHAPQVRQIMRREVSGILDTPLFKVTLQLLLGPEGVYEVKSSALEKAMEVLSTTPVSAALRENCRQEIERTLVHAAADVAVEHHAGLWGPILREAWKLLPPALAAVGFVTGWIVGWLLAAS